VSNQDRRRRIDFGHSDGFPTARRWTRLRPRVTNATLTPRRPPTELDVESRIRRVTFDVDRGGGYQATRRVPCGGSDRQSSRSGFFRIEKVLECA
jgi:hypothetical protein